jgi:hypothetical protein
MSVTNKKLSENIDELLKNVTEEQLANLNMEEIIELRKALNPYGRTIEGSDNYLNFSVTILRDEYMKKLLTTGLVGFLFRMCDEWKVPLGVPVVPVDEYFEDPTKIEASEKIAKSNDKSLKYDYEFNKKWMDKRVIVYEFLEEIFQFNPDEHVRSAHYPERKDKTRKPINTRAGKLAADHLCKTDRQFRETEAGYELKKKENEILHGIRSDLNDNNYPTAKTYTTPTGDGKDALLPSTVRNVIPPHDTFGRFTRYVKENYEQVREAVNDLYCEKPDMELAINPFSWHKTLEDAETFKKKNSKEIISEMYTAHSGKWNFFDSFKKQRESVQFFNDDTIVLEAMIKNLERDEKLARDIMQKKKNLAKKKNIIEEGPHAESFEVWKKNNPQLQKMQDLGQKSESDAAAIDGSEVNVWKFARGGLDVTRSKFHTLHEAPTFASTESVQEHVKRDELKSSDPLL